MIPDYEHPRQNGPTFIPTRFPLLSSPLLSSPLLSFPLLSFPLLSFPLLSSPHPCPHYVLKQMYVNLYSLYNKPFFNIQKVLYIQVSPDSPSSPLVLSNYLIYFHDSTGSPGSLGSTGSPSSPGSPGSPLVPPSPYWPLLP